MKWHHAFITCQRACVTLSMFQITFILIAKIVRIKSIVVECIFSMVAQKLTIDVIIYKIILKLIQGNKLYVHTVQ